MVGSFAEAFGPAAFRFFLPIRVVGCGGGSYFGFSFYNKIRLACKQIAFLLYLFVVIFAIAARVVSTKLRLLISLNTCQRNLDDFK